MYAAATLLGLLVCGEGSGQIAPGSGAVWTAPPRPRAWIAGAGAPSQTPGGDRLGGTEPRAEHENADSGADGSRAPLQVSLEAAGGSRGEAALQAVAEWRGDGISVGLGAEGVAGPRMAARQGMIAQAEVELGAVALHGEVRLRPVQAGASRSAAELGARVEGGAGSLDLSLRGVSALVASEAQPPGVAGEGEAAFASVGGSAEASVALSGALAAGLRLAAFANQLRWSGRAPAQSWEALGASLQEWPDRWEAIASMRAASRLATATFLAGAGAPAAAGAIAARGALRLELDLGAATLSAALGGAHQWPARLWLAELTVGASFRFGGRGRPGAADR